MSERWRQVRLGNCDIAIHETWTVLASQSAERVAYGCDEARVDVALSEASFPIDPGRAKQLETGFHAIGFNGTASLIELAGHSAVLYSGAGNGARVLGYTIGYTPAAKADGQVVYPETQIIYAASGVWAERLTETKSYYRTQPISLAGENVNVEGRLSFGPILVPTSWVLEGDDGEPLTLPNSTADFREVDVAGGYVFFRDSKSSDGKRSSLLFQPYLFRGGSQKGAKDAEITAELRACFPTMELTRVARSPVMFAKQDALSYLLVGDGLTRHGAVWRDALGYWWELVYIVQNRDLERLQPTIATPRAKDVCRA